MPDDLPMYPHQYVSNTAKTHNKLMVSIKVALPAVYRIDIRDLGQAAAAALC